MAAGHHVRDSALPSGRAAPRVPPPASRTASGQAVAPPASRTASGEAVAPQRFLLLSAERGSGGAAVGASAGVAAGPRADAGDGATGALGAAAAFGAAVAGSGQRSPVTRDSRL